MNDLQLVQLFAILLRSFEYQTNQEEDLMESIDREIIIITIITYN